MRLSRSRVKKSAAKRTSSAAHSDRQASRWQQLFFRWLDKRVARAQSITLTRRNLFIFPTATGFAFLLLSFVLWLLGSSYQNNLVLALSYLLISLLVVAIFHTYANLAGLQVKVLGAKPAFAGESVHFILQVQGKRGKSYDNLMIRWWNGEAASFDFTGEQPGQIQVAVHAARRGYLQPGKLLIASRFPLGLIRCWSWLNLDARALIFPKPLKTDFSKQALADNDSAHGEQLAKGDEFAGLKEYRAGDPVKHIAWKHYAREQGLYCKEYSSARSSDSWLEWLHFPHLSPEDRLSALCYWALQFERSGIAYGLRLPGKQLPPALSHEHRLTVLSALACFDIQQDGD